MTNSYSDVSHSFLFMTVRNSEKRNKQNKLYIQQWKRMVTYVQTY